jgi:hypothetical protein
MSLRRIVVRHLTLLSAILAALAPAEVSLAQRPQSSGIFTDRSNKQYRWGIDIGHTLVWNGAPYVPVGGNFSPHYLAEGSTEENWAKDVEALGKLKEKGVLDIIVQPVISAVDVPAASWQKLVDHLDAQGFRYGISFGAGIATPVTGWVVKPTNYRIEEVRENVDVSWNVADADSGYYVLVDSGDAAQIAHEGVVKVRSGVASVPGRAASVGSMIGIFYPHKALKGSREWTLPDVWGSFDRYRDRLLATFSQVQFGAGLRFFLDPLARSLGVRGESDYLVPSSAPFRLEWEAHLTQRYPAVDDLMNAWGINDRSVQDFKQAARLLPLYADGRGVTFFLDTLTNKRLECRGLERFWTDLREYRDNSLVYYMNAAADLLKRDIADVPVVYTRTHHHRIFTNKQPVGGFDGLGIAAYGSGSSVTTSGADSAYSQVTEAARPLWCIATETMDTSSPTKPELGYASKQVLNYTLDWLRGIGVKGFYVQGLQVLPEAGNKNFQLVKSPEQLDWLREYSGRIGVTRVAGTHPTILPFPQDASAIVRPGPVGNSGVWWVPSLAPGRVLGYGSSYAGYTISLPPTEGGDMIVLWSLKGERQTHLIVNDPRAIRITTADGRTVQFKQDIKKKTAILPMDENPLIIRGADPEILPLEAVQDVLAELKALHAQAESQKLPASVFKVDLDRAQGNFTRSPKIAFIQAVDALTRLVNLIQPYAWIEGERPESHTFNEVTSSPAASGGGFLSLNTEARPGPSGYGATYRFHVPVDDMYTVWMAGTPLGANASPFAWIVDTGQPRLSTEGAQVGSPYMSNQFGWINLGRLSLVKGPHALTLRITDLAPGTSRYFFSLDTVLITRGAFTPNGTVRPSLVSDEELKGKVERPKEDRSKRIGKGSK